MYHLMIRFAVMFSVQTRLYKNLTLTRYRQPNIQKNQDVSIKEGMNTNVIGGRKREHRDERESEEKVGKFRKLSKASKPIDPCGEDDMGSRAKSQGHPHPKNPRADIHHKAGE